MKPFFGDMQATRWPYSDCRLHVYLLPDAAVADLAAAYQQGLDRAGIAGLSRVPAEWLHLSVQLLTVSTDDLTSDQMTRLVDELRAAVATVPVFDLTVGPALATATAVTLDVVPDQPWQALRTATRQAMTTVLGPTALPPSPDRPGWPHITIGYAQDPAPDTDAINNVRPGRATMSVACAHLVDVTQHPSVGMFTWKPITTLPLRSGVPRAPEATT